MSNITTLPGNSQNVRGIEALLAEAREYIDREIRGFYHKALVPGVSEPAALLQAALETLYALRLSGTREVRICGDNDDLYPEWLYDMMAVIPGGTIIISDQLTRFDLVIKISKQHKKIHQLVVDIISDGRSMAKSLELNREVQAAGHDIFQFVEAEVLADPWSCAARIADWSDALGYGA